MSNGHDDDPFKPRDATILRPRPGAGRRGAADPASGQSAPPQRTATSSHAPAAYAEPIPAAARDALGVGLNPLVKAASSILILAGRVRGSLQGSDAGNLRRQALEEIRLFEERARAGGVANEVVLAARYALCAVLDEAVLSTPWGAQSEWAQQTLLVTLHREAWGGEKFFDMLERIIPDPTRHIDLMELLYLCMSMGFAGKFQVLERGHARLAEVQHDLYGKIRSFRGAPAGELSLRWQGLQDRRNPLIRFVPWWVVGAAALLVLTIAFIIFYARLNSAAAPLHAQLARVGINDFTIPADTAPVAGPSLKQLLAQDVSSGAVQVEEQGARTVITLTVPNLFASGSTTVNTQHYDVLRRIADALDQVPGRVLVVGHTDDQPLTSFRYRDNFELSRERAVAVVGVLRLAIDQTSRIEWTGVGSTEPRYKPESLPENRARNRRVEIVHLRESAAPATDTLGRR
jgi:type VI secretion system protein ImpK